MLTVLLAVLYPFLAHAAVIRHSEALTAVSLACLAAAALAPGLMARKPAAWGWAVVLAAAIAALYFAHVAGLPLYAPPVAVDTTLAFVFGLTLRAGKVPLIERLVRLLHDPEEQLDPAIFIYARRLTLAWCLLFTGLAAMDVVLALCTVPGGILDLAGFEPPFQVSPETWSLLANFIGYAIAGGFFVLEYNYRRRRFPHQPYRNFIDFVQRAARVGPQVLK